MVIRNMSFGDRRGLPGGKYTCRRCGKETEFEKNEDSIRFKCPDCGGTCDPDKGLQPENSARYSTEWSS